MYIRSKASQLHLTENENQALRFLLKLTKKINLSLLIKAETYKVLATSSLLNLNTNTLSTKNNKAILKFCFLAIGLLLNVSGNTQEVLSKAEAVEILLKNNYGIKVARNNRLVAENNISKENNGYLPTVNATAGPNANLGGSSQKFNSGAEANVKNAFTWSANASVAANYTLIDKQRDVTLEQLKELVGLSDFEIRQTIELNLLQMFSGYYEVARLTENLKVLTQTIELSKRRLKRAEYRYEYGQGLKLDILNAQVDIQQDSINFLRAEQQLANSKRNLNFIIGQTIDADIKVDTTVSYTSGLSLEALLVNAETKNIDIIISDKNLSITNYDLKIIEAGKKPVLGSSASYNYSYSDNAAESFITSSTSQGLTVGVNLSWNIFDGGLRKIRTQNTQVAIRSQQVLREQTLQALRLDVTNAWENYQNALFILDAEKNNLTINQLNFERTEELFKAGQVSSVEIRQAQLNLLNAATNYNTAKYDAKVIEIQLLQLSGEIMEVEF